MDPKDEQAFQDVLLGEYMAQGTSARARSIAFQVHIPFILLAGDSEQHQEFRDIQSLGDYICNGEDTDNVWVGDYVNILDHAMKYYILLFRWACENLL